MSGIVEKLRLKEQAEEDLYFARRERELAQTRREPPATQDERPRVLAGGQTGVDRGALDAAMGLGLAVGGWCPRGRWAEDGPIPARYPLQETPLRNPAERTDRNLCDSDATLILHRGHVAAGTELTVRLARDGGRPLLIRDLTGPVDAGEIARWLLANRVRTLNCAGPRESEEPGIQVQAETLLREVLTAWAAAA